MTHHQQPSTRDQAEGLRRLVAQHACSAILPLCADGRHRKPSAPRARLVAVAGGKGGVGVTTLAVNIAVAAAQTGRRCLLVDVDGECGDVACLTGLRERHTVADVLARRRRLADCIQPGPAGLKVLVGAWGFERLSDHPPASAEVLIEQIFEMSGELDLAVLDCGNSRGSMTERFWRAADVVLTVSSVEPAAILDTYSAIKQICHPRALGKLLSVVNLAPDRAAAESVQQRLQEACHRFLAIAVTGAGTVCYDEAVAAANRCAMPVVLRSPDCQASTEIRALAEITVGYLGIGKGVSAAARETLKIRAGGSR